MQDKPSIKQYQKTLKDAIGILQWVIAHKENDAKLVQVCTIWMIEGKDMIMLARWNPYIEGIYENTPILSSLLHDIKPPPVDTIIEPSA